ncbi:hypothetical protein [Kordia zhangzhouensis]|uniref:hypothetical protein n=1 Tax=Kordia zhangzhouensis TaxID=1620405 RepID=UPI000629725D|nr:hypothetical protein [Kordia zhangzhouensis]
MKKSALFFAFCTFFLIVSCGSDDDTNSSQSQSGNYFPATPANYWKYDVTVPNGNGSNQLMIDSLYVASRSGNSFTLGVNTTNIGFGFMNNMLTTGTLTEQGTALTIDSSFSIPINGITAGINFENLVLFDSNATNNQLLYTTSDTFTQNFQGVPITVNYTVSSVKTDELNSLTVAGNSYSNINVVDIDVEASISTSIDVFGIPTTISILDAQDIIHMKTYYAANVGIIKSDSQFSYQLNPTTVALLANFNIDLGIPSSDTSENIQELNSYMVED